MTEWLARSLESWQPTTNDVTSALRNFRPRIKKQLLSQSNWERRNALGKLYEYAVYERIRTLSQDTDLVKYVIRKGRDITQGAFLRASLDQNGLFYSRQGDIYVRGNGQDLAEFDILLVDNQDKIALVEVLATKINKTDFAKECAYKKNLLKFLFGDRMSNLIVVSPIDLSSDATFRRAFLNTESIFVHANSIESSLSNLNPTELNRPTDTRSNCEKLASIDQLHARQFNYRYLHAEERDRLIGAALQQTEKVENLVQRAYESIVKNVIIGILGKFAVSELLRTRQLILSKSRGSISTSEFQHYFSKALLVMSLPELRPILYLRVERRRNYLKLGPATLSTFKFERNIEEPFTKLFNWLEETNTYIDNNMMQKILDYYLREAVVTERKKRLQYPKL